MASTKSNNGGSKSKGGSKPASKGAPESRSFSMPSRKVLIEATLSVLGIATAAAIIFVPTVRSSNAEPAEQGSSWTDLDRGPDAHGKLEPASDRDKPVDSRQRNGDP